MFSKFGKEKKLFKTDSFRVKYGTIDALKLNAIYINIDSWVEPKELVNFESNIRLTRKNIISKLNQVIDKEIFLDNFIVDLDLRSSGMFLNKKSFMSIEVTLYPKKFIKFNSDLIKTQVKNVALSTIEMVQKNNFNFYSKK
jgi:metal-sulfur cluster biosynthetic enzyme